MNKSLVGFLGVLVAAAIFAGCGSGSYTAATTATPTPVPTPSVACVLPTGEVVGLVYPPASPMPTASGSAYAQGIIVASAPSPLPTNWYAYAVSPLVTPAAAGIAAGMTMTAPPSPLPTPFTDPGYPNETIQYSPNGIFGTGAGTWQVYVASTSCFPGVLIGSFNS